MTNDEIIKALFACSIKGNCPADCPYQSIKDTGIDGCFSAICGDALELIQSLQAQIKTLEGQNRCLISEVKIKENNLNHLQERYNDAHAIVKKVNERFINKCRELQTVKVELEKVETNIYEIAMQKAVAEKVRAEAIKEFAESLKGYFGTFNTYGVGAFICRAVCFLTVYIEKSVFLLNEKSGFTC